MTTKFSYLGEQVIVLLFVLIKVSKGSILIKQSFYVGVLLLKRDYDISKVMD